MDKYGSFNWKNETGAHMATEIKAGDTVECIELSGKLHFDSAVPLGKRLTVATASTYALSFKEVNWRLNPARFKKVEPEVKIDWTKPIQWDGDKWDGDKPAKFIAEIEGKYIVWRNGGVCAYNKDGSFGRGGRQWITNVPPPPVWPVKRWFVRFEKDGEARLSGPSNTLEAAERQKKALELRHQNVVIQEVTFG